MPLGVCTSVLKKISQENGLDPWPYRKILDRKSIVEIKRYAAWQKQRELAASNGSQHQSIEESKSKALRPMHRLQQDGHKSHGIGKSNVWGNSSLAKAMTTLDEFRWGFPSDGLSTVTNKWWGSNSPGKDIRENGEESAEGGKCQSDTPKDDNSSEDNTKQEDGNVSNKDASESPDTLVAIRKRIAEEGREAVKLGVYRGLGSKHLSRRDRVLLVQIFKSSLPKDWLTGSS